MEVVDSVYEQLAKSLLDAYKKDKKPYFKGCVVDGEFILDISCIFYDDHIVPVWWECENKYDFEFDKLRTKYKELCKQYQIVMETKVCKVCGQELPLSEFKKTTFAPNGISTCNKCCARKAQEKRESNKLENRVGGG